MDVTSAIEAEISAVSARLMAIEQDMANLYAESARLMAERDAIANCLDCLQSELAARVRREVFCEEPIVVVDSSESAT